MPFFSYQKCNNHNQDKSLLNCNSMYLMQKENIFSSESLYIQVSDILLLHNKLEISMAILKFSNTYLNDVHIMTKLIN